LRNETESQVEAVDINAVNAICVSTIQTTLLFAKFQDLPSEVQAEMGSHAPFALGVVLLLLSLSFEFVLVPPTNLPTTNRPERTDRFFICEHSPGRHPSGRLLDGLTGDVVYC
jgi:hypothetical protein